MIDIAGPVAIKLVDRIVQIVIDNPPVNASNRAVRQGLMRAVAEICASSEIDAAVISCAGRTFVAGGDIREFDQPPLMPSLPEVCNAIENCTKPIVAAVHGTALGGGLEIALSCHARVFAKSAKFGLPEVKLGLVPGAGGTQRLPRLIGLERTLELVTSARLAGAVEALESGLADLVDDDPVAAATAFAGSLVGSQIRRTGALSVEPLTTARLLELRDAVVRKARGQESPVAAFDLTAASANVGLVDGMAQERAAFVDLMASSQSRALRHVYFAEREAFRVPDLLGILPRDVAKVGIVGAGTMGSGIAVALADAGLAVTVVDVAPAAREAGRGRVASTYENQVKSGRITGDQAQLRLNAISFADRFEDLAEVDLVIEAVFEDMAVKKDLFGHLGRILREGAILATNTSYLDVGEIGAASGRPTDVIGLHFFAPANIMKLVEIVRSQASSTSALATAVALAKRLGKIPVVCGVCDGFVGNRILAAYRQQAEFMLEEGALPQDVDAAMVAFGFPMGPFAVSDLSGLDIAWARRKRLASIRDPNQRYSSRVADRLCQMGRLGQKTGSGWYRYVDNRREEDSIVRQVIEDVSRELGFLRRPINQETIQNRLQATMMNEARRILDDKIVLRGLDVDLAMIHGFGYPAWRGGPIFEATEIGIQDLLAELEAVQSKSGPGWEPARGFLSVITD
jgi:3-hydroxyacyl-CoA dehydrogenase